MRHQDWPTRLEREIDRFKNEPFQWGVSDCVQFARHCVAAQVDYDILSMTHFDYTTKEGAEAIINDHYAGYVGNIFSDFLTPKSREHAGSGDLVVIDLKGEKIAAIVDNTGRRICAKTENGVISLPIKFVERAWSVE